MHTQIHAAKHAKHHAVSRVRQRAVRSSCSMHVCAMHTSNPLQSIQSVPVITSATRYWYNQATLLLAPPGQYSCTQAHTFEEAHQAVAHQ